ncbi:MAG TPA: hypothetical protein PKD12_04710 [Nitrospira sp.]|nr:hypothetical protein [Nitrospira sp.]
MLTRPHLKDALHQAGLSKTDRLLICLLIDPQHPKSVSAIKDLARAGGIHSIKTWNISSLLSASKGKAVRTGDGWELTQPGIDHARKLTSHLSNTVAPLQAAVKLRDALHKIVHLEARSFVEEAVLCFDYKLYRAAVVLSWVGAVSILYQHVVSNKLLEFNTAASARFTKWKSAKTSDDLALLKETDFLLVLQDISIIGKSVRQELESRLKLRNGCGHPNSLVVGEHTVSAHIEVLIDNIFSKFTA